MIFLARRERGICLRIVERSLELYFESMRVFDRPNRLEYGAAEEFVLCLVR
jgi:hypothetical protein